MTPAASNWRALAGQWILLLELALAVMVVHLYQIEGTTFARVMTLSAAGFVVSALLPRHHRLPFFVLLSLGGVFWVLGVADGAWLVLLGLALLAVAHAPIPLGARIVALLVVGAGLAALRAGHGATPWSSAVWPILGSMFMFRMALYLKAIASGQVRPGIWGALAYFFMLPNVAFPLFPVVDYQTFGRTHFDKEDRAIYEQGLLWISRGLLQLVLYRFVYFNVLNDPADVDQLSELVQNMLGTFLLYLRVSGQFHLIVGVLHLFGFRLPETHKLYYLGHSFTELWRRINIYWTDFMMKMVFYPVFFRLKRLAGNAPIIIATAAVFLTTWVLHSYQWFWLRGGFPVTMPDILFWGILGALVIRSALKELRTPRSTKQAALVWNWRLGLKAATTFSLFCFLWSLWSSESLAQWLWLLGAAGNPDVAGMLMIVGAAGTIFLLGGWNPAARGDTLPRWLRPVRSPAFRTLVPLLLLLLAGQPFFQAMLPDRAGAAVRALMTTNLNARDAAQQHRGYYEQLDVRGQVGALGAANVRPPEWQTPAEAGIIRERPDLLTRDLHPSLDIVWNGNVFTTNAHGMRDKDYALAKPADTVRIALLGPSHVMGNGVADGEPFESIVEERLNLEMSPVSGKRYEILNFGVDGYSLPQQLAILEDRVLEFAPDIVILTNYHEGASMTESYLMKVVDRGARLADGTMQGILEQEGLPEGVRGRVPLPYGWLRSLARSAGMEARMPHAEIAARARRIRDDINDLSISRIAEICRARGIGVIALGLDAVTENTPDTIPNARAIEAAGLPFINLFDMFPAAQRAQLRVARWDDHPNTAGHRLIANRLYTELVPLIEARNGATPPDAQGAQQ